MCNSQDNHREHWLKWYQNELWCTLIVLSQQNTIKLIIRPVSVVAGVLALATPLKPAETHSVPIDRMKKRLVVGKSRYVTWPWKSYQIKPARYFLTLLRDVAVSLSVILHKEGITANHRRLILCKDTKIESTVAFEWNLDCTHTSLSCVNSDRKLWPSKFLSVRSRPAISSMVGARSILLKARYGHYAYFLLTLSCPKLNTTQIGVVL